jgi:hypothetical protein
VTIQLKPSPQLVVPAEALSKKVLGAQQLRMTMRRKWAFREGGFAKASVSKA